MKRNIQVLSVSVQEFNRDLSILCLRYFLKNYVPSSNALFDHSTQGGAGGGLARPNCFEALSASGLRSIRYAKEIPQLKAIVANDISKKAVAAIERNIEVNQVQEKVKASHGGKKTNHNFPTWLNQKVHPYDCTPY